MSQNMVFFDVDGTLLDQNMQMPSSTKQAIQQLQAKGFRIAIATGREPSMFKHIMDELNIHSFISCNGSYVVYEGEVVYQHAIHPTELSQLNDQAIHNGHGMVFSNMDKMWSSVDDHPYIREALHHLEVDYPGYKSYGIDNISYALLFCQESEEPVYRGKYQHLDFIRWHEYSLDVIPKGGSKAKGIEKLLDHLGVKKDQAVAFGDGLNDIEMLSFVGTGVAMGNAHDDLKEVADIVTEDVSQHGIREGLKKIGLL